MFQSVWPKHWEIGYGGGVFKQKQIGGYATLNMIGPA